MNYIVTRHIGAVEWLQSKGINGKVVAHLDPDILQPQDCVYGNLPMVLAWKICQMGAHYHHISIVVPEQMRGRELTAQEMSEVGARVDRFFVSREGTAGEFNQ